MIGARRSEAELGGHPTSDKLSRSVNAYRGTAVGHKPTAKSGEQMQVCIINNLCACAYHRRVRTSRNAVADEDA